VDEVVEGDVEIGAWGVIGKYKPDVIALGYDQIILGDALREYIQKNGLKVRVVVMEAHVPEKYHSSLFRSEKSQITSTKSQTHPNDRNFEPF
ncbi:MAG: hypothetical protein Q8R20_00950, partial [Nanoarchaeota archaeon]|nr:hypothetical protein [Nanoarchaeota archaeon]